MTQAKKVLRGGLFLLLFAIGFCLISACGESEPVKTVDLSQREEVTVYRPEDSPNTPIRSPMSGIIWWWNI